MFRSSLYPDRSRIFRRGHISVERKVLLAVRFGVPALIWTTVSALDDALFAHSSLNWTMVACLLLAIGWKLSDLGFFFLVFGVLICLLVEYDISPLFDGFGGAITGWSLLLTYGGLRLAFSFASTRRWHHEVVAPYESYSL